MSLTRKKELLAYYPVISDNLRYISYFILRTDETDGESIPGGKWEIILLDLHSESKTSLLSEVWVPKPSNEEVIGKCPVSFSSDSRYLYYDNSSLYINPLDYFGGRIELATNEITEGVEKNNYHYQLHKIFDGDKCSYFEQGPPGFRIDGFYIYDFITGQFSLCQQVDFKEALLQNGSLFFYKTFDAAFIVNCNKLEYAELPALQSISNFGEINEDGKLIEFTFDKDGNYQFVILDLSEYEDTNSSANK